MKSTSRSIAAEYLQQIISVARYNPGGLHIATDIHQPGDRYISSKYNTNPLRVGHLYASQGLIVLTVVSYYQPTKLEIYPNQVRDRKIEHMHSR